MIPICIKQQSKQITRIKTLKEYTSDIDLVKALILELCKSVYGEVIQRELHFKSVGLIFIDNKFSIVNRSKSLKNYTQNLNDLIDHANSIFLDYISEYDLFKLRRIGVKVSEIKKMKARIPYLIILKVVVNIYIMKNFFLFTLTYYFL